MHHGCNMCIERPTPRVASVLQRFLMASGHGGKRSLLQGCCRQAAAFVDADVQLLNAGCCCIAAGPSAPPPLCPVNWSLRTHNLVENVNCGSNSNCWMAPHWWHQQQRVPWPLQHPKSHKHSQTNSLANKGRCIGVVLLAGNTTRLDGAAGLAALVWTPSIVQ
jgi:hypothetical protein